MTAPWNLIAQAIFPRRCASCETPLAHYEPAWCGPCEFLWTRSSVSSTQRFGGRLDWAFGVSWLRMAGPEERRLVHNLKYGGNATLGKELGKTMARELTASPHMPSCAHWSVVPIPLHWRRKRQRGYNQSEQLASGWSALTHMNTMNLLSRPKAGVSLTKMNRAQRLTHVKNPFTWLNPPALQLDTLHGVLIVDDVVTTGSTLERAHTAIRQHWQGPLGFVTLLDAIH